MALLKGSGGGGGGSVAPPPRDMRRRTLPRLAPPPERRASDVGIRTGARLGRPAGPAPAPARVRGPAVLAQPARQQSPQQFFQVAPAPAIIQQPQPVVQVVPEPPPLAVQVAPQQEPVVVQPEGTYSPWIGSGPRLDQNQWVQAQEGALFTNSAKRKQSVQNVEDRYEMQAKLGDRDRRRVLREKTDRQETASELTPDQWASYSPMQQAAVQANYDLSQAVARDFDKRTRHSATSEQVRGYQERVKELFGENATTGYKGLEYAPNTLAFIDSRGLKAADLAGRTLDDFLSGDVLMTEETIGKLDRKPSGAKRQRNLSLAQQISKGQLAYQEGLAEKLQVGEQMLSGITSHSTVAAATDSYGADSRPTEIPLSKVRPETAEVLDLYMEALALPDVAIDEALEIITLDLQQRGATPEESDQVWQALTERSRQAVVGQGQWFPGVDLPMRSPVEVAQALDAPTLKRRATQTAGGD